MFETEYKTIDRVYGPLVIVKGIGNAAYNEIVKINMPNGEQQTGQVLETTERYAVVQIFGDTAGIDVEKTSVRFTGEVLELGVGIDMLGRIFDGSGNPRDFKSGYIAEEKRNVNGEPINPVARAMPNDFIETGVSAIDALMTLVRGQKLPIFTGSGLPHDKLMAQITRQANVRNSSESFAVVFAGIGATYDDASYFINELKKTGAINRTVAFVNYANDPSIERIITPRLALTTAEYLAFTKGMHVLVVMTDMTNYCEALREISSARDEVPGRRGYPGYMYTDLASLYERAGIIKGKKGSITQLEVVTLPSDDVTHPIPDLTGYITEGQIFISRELNTKGIYPAVTPIGSLSRLQNNGVGPGKTREDHKNVSDQLYGAYAKAQDAKSLSSIVGAEALSDLDKLYLKFGNDFEKRFLGQDFNESRTIEQTLDLGWELLSGLPESELSRIKKDFIVKYYKKGGAK